MSATIQQIILHPRLTDTIKVASTTVGRDKAYRTIQYLSRFLAWYFAQKGYSQNAVARFSAIKTVLGSVRKCMRIGKPLEHLQSAAKALNETDPFIKATTFGRQMGYAGYLFYDMLAFLQSSKIVSFEPPFSKEIGQKAARLWATGIGFSILTGLYKYYLLTTQYSQIRATDEKGTQSKVIQEKLYQLKYQLVQDALDLLLPTGTLKLHNLDEGVLGLAGFATSLMGLRSQVKKVLKV